MDFGIYLFVVKQLFTIYFIHHIVHDSVGSFDLFFGFKSESVYC